MARVSEGCKRSENGVNRERRDEDLCRGLVLWVGAVFGCLAAE